MRTFRHPQGGTVIAGMMAVYGIGLVGLVLAQMATGTYLRQFGQIYRHDPAYSIPALCLMAVFLTAAVMLFCFTRFPRVEVDSGGIRIFNLKNEMTFASPWTSVTSLRVPDPPSGEWVLDSSSGSASIPSSVINYPELMRYVAGSIPASARPQAPPLANPNPIPPRSLSHWGGSVHERTLAFFSFAWLAIGAGLFVLLAATRPDPLSAAVWFFILSLNLGSVLTAGPRYWRATWKRSSQIDANGVTVVVGSDRVSIPWSEITFAEVRRVASPRTTELVVASSSQSLKLDHTEATYLEAVRGVFNLPPPSAILSPGP
jgi:hypothetical protein